MAALQLQRMVDGGFSLARIGDPVGAQADQRCARGGGTGLLRDPGAVVAPTAPDLQQGLNAVSREVLKFAGRAVDVQPLSVSVTVTL